MKNLLKRIVLGLCGRSGSLRLRRHFVARQVLRGEEEMEPEYALIHDIVGEGHRVVDIGANVGEYTKLFSSLVGASGRVLAFEPLAENFAILQRVIDKGDMRNVEARRAAIGAACGSFEMVIPKCEGFVGYYQAHLARADEAGGGDERETVDVVTLDALGEDSLRDGVEFVKCDVEGAELDVLRGGTESIPKWRPGWLIEVSRGASEAVFAFMRERGYSAFVYSTRLEPTDGYRDGEYSNYLFFHPESPHWERVQALL